MEHSIFYHEDDYRQVELLPSENFNDLIKQAENLQDFAEQHFDAMGYTELMVREDKGLKLSQRGIGTKELDSCLCELGLEKYTEVSTGIRPGEMESKNTMAYGQNYKAIFFDYEVDTVQDIWIAGTPDVDKTLYAEVLHKLGMKWNLLLMDWNSLELIDLRNKAQIEKYLN
ncbi:hypothetical protein [Croceimicrobium hydrocarbonivorans]|uniref:Uncharacterized protein n=1 Tax=Croceimicrobium hydrocarbonivorans TaxID=2761580 RepID=A0A7H0VFP0_9FLAO|nr:hypothetical protein [Croceimicrobium hydrocarbonivorans]QNR24538.1 hypothetical protein H4K34_01475 [Croceimicrobium hydrocarbonivorans]